MTFSSYLKDNYGISRAEYAVGYFLLHGMTNGEIAHRINVTEKTVKFHCTALYKKTRGKNRLDFVVKLKQEIMAGEAVVDFPEGVKPDPAPPALPAPAPPPPPVDVPRLPPGVE